MVSRPPDTPTYEISRGGYREYGLGAIFNLTGIKVYDSGLKENIQNIQTFFTHLHLRSNVLRISNEQDLRSALIAMTNPPRPLLTSIVDEDSLVYIALISRGDAKKTILPDGNIVLHTQIEQYFNEDNCRMLRGKPKLFLHFLDYTKISEKKELIDFQPPAAPVTEDIDLHMNISSTSLHILSYYIYDFGLSSFLTENKGSLVLNHLPRDFNLYGHDYDFESFLKKFLGNVYELEDPGKERYSSICIMRNRLVCKLSIPSREERLEEQDVEVYLSDDLNRQASLYRQISHVKTSPLRIPQSNNNQSFFPYPVSRPNPLVSNSKNGSVKHNTVNGIIHSSKTKFQRRVRAHDSNPNRQLQTMKSAPNPNTSILFEDSINFMEIHFQSQ